MAWNPFKKLEQNQETALDAAISSWEAGNEDEKKFAAQEIVRLYNIDPAMFEDKEDQVIVILKKYGGEDIGKVLQKLTEKRAKEIHTDSEKTQEMPALTDGMIELMKTKKDFENFPNDVDDLMGYIGAIRQLSKNQEYLSDKNYNEKVAQAVQDIGDAVTTWQNPQDKAHLDKKYARLIDELPAEIRKDMLKEVA